MFESKSYVVLPRHHTLTDHYSLKEALHLARAIARVDGHPVMIAEVTGRRWIVQPDATDTDLNFLAGGK